jgi:hypothetical protein
MMLQVSTSQWHCLPRYQVPYPHVPLAFASPQGSLLCGMHFASLISGCTAFAWQASQGLARTGRPLLGCTYQQSFPTRYLPACHVLVLVHHNSITLMSTALHCKHLQTVQSVLQLHSLVTVPTWLNSCQ